MRRKPEWFEVLWLRYTEHKQQALDTTKHEGARAHSKQWLAAGKRADLVVHVAQLSSQARPAPYSRSPHLALSHLRAKDSCFMSLLSVVVTAGTRLYPISLEQQ